jgi:predicted nucleic acid-binding protein
VNVLVDTSIWSLVFRRQLRIVDRATIELASLIRGKRAFLIGPIRQELLSGIRETVQFEAVRDSLRPFPDLPIHEPDYEEAALFYNRCRARGIQGSNTDFLVCAVAARLSMSILTTDRDFEAYANLLPIKLHEMSLS